MKTMAVWTSRANGTVTCAISGQEPITLFVEGKSPAEITERVTEIARQNGVTLVQYADEREDMEA